MNCFERALDIAGKQDALFWQLRAALSLAQFMINLKQPSEARQVLAPVYSCFTEGFGSPDLLRAEAMLASQAL
jgi:predicted ATPase